MRINKESKINISLFFVIFFSIFLNACGQENIIKDIEEKLQGTWVGTAKDFDLKDVNELNVLFDKDNIRLRKNYYIGTVNKKVAIPDSDKKYRIFIHSNGDTIIEQRYNMVMSTIKEPIYGKLHIVNKNEIRIFFLFKMNEKSFLGLNLERDGWYLKRSLSQDGMNQYL
ncbi:hypothetical protein DU508_07850 [Pedobacter chinensis]|uniref:Uncharacterized protein n=1 Tax=Pedobacter chinensis TaxID=2282421 RepID=A0A369PX63_9SPHI|nr:hypothetical protein [Pedobacter chinensis]RDC57094.1 hypothetical protein DU508_07850 [Pedobacter chinensis]